ncbi:DUF1304 domain-containing protein [Abyssibacter sp.]|jgi:putative membrane protein|uniref:DUF1304 domain-containing protein n=1 Tax=Abyssibacter sp. TaxID=2320200 RepID=UPI000C54CE55|nr:DUF1304 domain-containing protein [Abyssibacter sp.]MBB85727.1 epimerase [Xanthomonadales bacterium]MCK5859413.1 DUF1304 domain-containing protein [Abyssibacter sp.]
MQTIALIPAGLAALLHIVFFLFESVLFSRRDIQKRFQVASPDAAEAIRPWALNQGFYNLFLAVGLIHGIIVTALGYPATGRPIMLVICAVMVGAAVVLGISDARMRRAALLQGVPPLAAVVLLSIA